MAPLGYLNDYRKKQIVVDRERAPIVRDAFERYARGEETVEGIRHFLADGGIRTRTGKPVANTYVTRMFSDPLYYGHFRYAGEIYEGIHEPIISKDLFDAVRAVFAKRYRYSPKMIKTLPKTFTRLLRCAECGYSITGEAQKGQVYYRCTKKNKGLKCGQPYVREEILAAELRNLVCPFTVGEPWVKGMLAQVEIASKQGSDILSRQRLLAKDKIAGLNQKIGRLLEMRLDGEIGSADYLDRKTNLMSERKTLEERASSTEDDQRRWLEPLRMWIKDAQAMDKIIKTGSHSELKGVAEKIFGSNLFLDLKKARGVAVHPWALLLENELSHDLERSFETARRYFQEGRPL
jgi:site-specific DNA recombinase